MAPIFPGLFRPIPPEVLQTQIIDRLSERSIVHFRASATVFQNDPVLKNIQLTQHRKEKIESTELKLFLNEDIPEIIEELSKFQTILQQQFSNENNMEIAEIKGQENVLCKPLTQEYFAIEKKIKNENLTEVEKEQFKKMQQLIFIKQKMVTQAALVMECRQNSRDDLTLSPLHQHYVANQLENFHSWSLSPEFESATFFEEEHTREDFAALFSLHADLMQSYLTKRHEDDYAAKKTWLKQNLSDY